jgi:hypothetical protein
MTLRPSRAALFSLALVASVGGGVYGVSSCGGDSSNPGGDDASVDGDAQQGMDSPGPQCDANLQNDPHHCGMCTNACSTGQVCIAGLCKNECSPPSVVCSGVMGCVDLSTDLDHCGDCNRKCNAPEGGIPVPDGGAPEAGPDGGAGDAMADASSDASGDAPSEAGDDGGDDGGPVDDGQRIATATCAMGKCDYTCPAAPNVAKCGTDGCYDLTISPTHCGSCTTQCSGNCQQGVCCDPPSLVCGGVCTDVTTDPNNCGKCGNLCNVAGQSCNMGVCACPTGQDACNGACIDVTKDPNNCGSCGHVCHNGQQCLAGGCGAYTVTSPSTQAFVDACTLGGHTTVLPSTLDMATGVLTIPFTLQYWGSPTTQFWINVAGTVGLDGTPNQFDFPGELGNCPNAIPDGLKFMTSAALGVFGESSLETSATGICYGTQGAQPNRQLVVTWEDALDLDDTNSDLTFSAIMTETTNTIDFVYSKMNGTGTGNSQGQSAVVGIQSPQGLAGVTKWCLQQFATTVPQSVRFTPVP